MGQTSNLPPSRIVALVLAVAVGVVAYHEYQVRSAFEESRKPLLEHVPQGQQSTLLLKDVPSHLRGSPEHSTPEADVDAYTWKGWIFTYQVRLTHEPDGFVQKVESH
jgi:hypothetical protein